MRVYLLYLREKKTGKYLRGFSDKPLWGKMGRRFSNTDEILLLQWAIKEKYGIETEIYDLASRKVITEFTYN